MKTQGKIALLCAALLVAGLAACGGGGGFSAGSGSGGGGGISGAGSAFTVTDLVADTSAAPVYGGESTRQFDANLVNPWGLAFNPTGFVWVANNGSSTSTLYDGNGVAQSLIVSLPAGQAGSANPTGIVFNGSQDFMVSVNGASGATPFVFAGEAGTIAGWSPSVDRTHAITMVDNAGSGAVYKGLATASFAGANYLYATDFHNGRVDVYDTHYARATLPGSFTDPALPAGYAPFGIEAINGQIYVAYAMQDAAAHDDAGGPGLGLVDQFDSGGNFVTRLISPGGVLNSPWGMAMAPAGFGSFGGDLLVANFGDGTLHAFDPATGAMLGALATANGAPIVIGGLWGIAFGNGVNDQPATTLFFTGGPDDEMHGVYGRIDLAM